MLDNHHEYLLFFKRFGYILQRADRENVAGHLVAGHLLVGGKMRTLPVTLAIMVFVLFSLFALSGCGIDDPSVGACAISWWAASGGMVTCWEKLSKKDCNKYVEEYEPEVQFFRWHDDKACEDVPLLYYE
jgi:hypothetical protein